MHFGGMTPSMVGPMLAWQCGWLLPFWIHTQNQREYLSHFGPTKLCGEPQVFTLLLLLAFSAVEPQTIHQTPTTCFKITAFEKPKMFHTEICTIVVIILDRLQGCR